MLLQEWLEERGEWEDIHRDDILDLLERPNPFYNGTSLWKATVADIMLNGTASCSLPLDGGSARDGRVGVESCVSVSSR